MELSAKENRYQCLPISNGKSTLHMLKARSSADVKWSSPVYVSREADPEEFLFGAANCGHVRETADPGQEMLVI